MPIELTGADVAAIGGIIARHGSRIMYECDEDTYRAGIAAGLERAAQVAGPLGKRPCDCERCDCGNVGNAQDVAAWDAELACAAAIRALLK
jgi:hypothetical protein